MANGPGAEHPSSSLPPWMATQRPTANKAAVLANTGRALRQSIPTPDTKALLARQRAVGGGGRGGGGGPRPPPPPRARARRPPRGGGRPRPPRPPPPPGTDPESGLGELRPQMFRDKDAFAIYRALRSSDAVKLAQHLQEAPKAKSGRPAQVSSLALLVGMFLTVQEGGGCLMSSVAKTLYERLHPAAMRVLDLEPVAWVADADPDSSPEVWEQRRLMRQRQRGACVKRVSRAFHRLCDAIDPSIYAAGRVTPWTTHRDRARDMTDEEIQDRMDWLVFIASDLVRLPWQRLPAKVRAHYDGSAGIDATHLPVFARGRGANSTTAATEPMAGYWTRTGDHSGDQAPHTKSVFAYDLHLMVGADTNPEHERFPALPLAIAMTRPGEDPAGAFRRVATNYVAAVDWPRNYIAGDGLYTNAAPETFQNPARELGWRPVLSMPAARLGLQSVVNGFLVVEGSLYCPSMHTQLIDATIDLRSGRISQAEYDVRTKERKKYESRLKEQISSNKFRAACPASGKRPTVMCALKPASETPDRRTLISGPKLNVRDRIHPLPELVASEHRPTPCTCDAVTIDLTQHPDLARTLQPISYGTSSHTDVYNALRQPHEGLHGFMKDEGKEALAAAGKRRVHGYAANCLMAAVTISVAGFRKVRSFLDKARIDSTGTLFVTRPPRAGGHGRTGLPAGTLRLRDGP